METTTNNQTSPAAQPGAVDYAAALRQYSRYGRGRSMKKFCEDYKHPLKIKGLEK